MFTGFEGCLLVTQCETFGSVTRISKVKVGKFLNVIPCDPRADTNVNMLLVSQDISWYKCLLIMKVSEGREMKVL